MIIKLFNNKSALVFIALPLAFGLLLSACASQSPAAVPPPAEEPKVEEPKPKDPEPAVEEPKAEEPNKEAAKLTMSTPAFNKGEAIPDKYSCKGNNVSPPLNWTEPPSGTETLVLILDDPDAPGGVFTHWIVMNIPADVRELAEAAYRELPGNALHGKNDFAVNSYRGPCPPYGPAHHYQFTLYALDTTLDLPPGASKSKVMSGMEGHILDQFQLMGTFKR